MCWKTISITELRRAYDIRIFNYTDYIVLDDGELPLSRLIEYDGSDDSVLVRTYYAGVEKFYILMIAIRGYTSE
ncbi:MAG: hypothetical protein ACLSG8_00285 [Barnesiella sp.]